MPAKNNVDEEIKSPHFRVAIFGSARIKPNDKIYKTVCSLAGEIGQNGIDIVTGGGPGLMEAANAGHKKGRTVHSKAHSIGLSIELPWEAKINRHLDLTKHFDKFSGRLDEFMALSNVAVIMPGGIGTCLELFYTWQLAQVKHICNIPIIVQGDMWKELMDWIEQWPLKNGLISKKDLRNIHISKNNKETIGIISKAKELFEELGDDYCVNWKKYKLN